MRIRTKFLIAFFSIAVPLIAIGAYSILSTSQASTQMQDVLHRIQAVETLFQLKSSVDRALQELLTISTSAHLVADTGGDDAVAAFIASETEELSEANERVASLLSTFTQLSTEEQGSPELTANLASAIQSFQVVGASLLQAAESGSQDAMATVLLDLESATDAFEEAVSAALDPEIAAQTDLAQSVANNANIGVWATAVGFSILIGIMIFAGVGFGREIVVPANHIREAAEALLNGNYSHRTPVLGRDELGQAADTFNRMAEAVQERDRSLNDINANLEKRVEERTVEVRRAMALVEESSRLKSQFLANMSHELRTPLNAIIGFTGIMMAGMAGEVDDDARHMISRVQSNSERLLDLIDSVLDLAKIEAGRIEIMYAPVSPKALAERWKSETEVLAHEKNLSLEVTVDPALPDMLMGDDDRLTQVAVNLLSNAIKFTDVGSVKLNISKSGDDKWTIAVSDTGVGIPPHALNYIFDEFRQADGSTTRMYGGTGLGLSIARRLTVMMDGTIRVSSEVGKGSTFTVMLPLKPASQAEPVIVA